MSILDRPTEREIERQRYVIMAERDELRKRQIRTVALVVTLLGICAMIFAILLFNNHK